MQLPYISVCVPCVRKTGSTLKFRQINRYLEIVDDVFEYLPVGRTLRIIDFGCGKAYLTFALYHYLKKKKSSPRETRGFSFAGIALIPRGTRATRNAV